MGEVLSIGLRVVENRKDYFSNGVTREMVVTLRVISGTESGLSICFVKGFLMNISPDIFL